MAIEKPRSPLRIILWIVGGIVFAWGIVVFVDANVGRVSEEIGWPFILLAGPAMGLAGSRWFRRKKTRAPSPVHASPTQSPPQDDRPTGSRSQKTIFVSYRRDDSADVTGRIYDRLSSRFGTAQVFKDVDSIPLGRDFREVINDAVAKASVVVAVIGRHWLASESDEGLSRIHDPNDFVRTEVSAALRQGKPVIPVFVANAKMPMDSELPDDIKDLTYRNGVHVRPDPDFANDVERLIRGIERA